jgi:hypothetical protein
MTEIKSLLEKASSLGREGGPAEAWTKLRSWAEKESHPFAMKAAVFQFLEIHGTKPEAASIVPEVLHTAATMHLEPHEKKNLISLSDRAFRALEFNVRKDHLSLPVENNRPAPALTMNPYSDKRSDIYAPVTPSRDINHLIDARDTIYHVNEGVIKKVKPNER